MANDQGNHIALVGAGVIGLSLAAFHIQHLDSSSQLSIIDNRPNLSEYVSSGLAKILPQSLHQSISGIHVTADLADGVKDATIVQESGPENLEFKKALWPEVEHLAPANCLFWTSTTGIPASRQNVDMKDKSRLLVVHTFNPPHILPLVELVPSPDTSQAVIDETLSFWRARGRDPILLRKEIPGFVAGRLAWALLREAIHLVDQNVATVEEIDRAIESSMGVRWAFAGPFKSFHAGGGDGGLEALMKNVGGTIQACWDDQGKVDMGGPWEATVFKQAKEAYGVLDLSARDRVNAKILDVVHTEKDNSDKLST